MDKNELKNMLQNSNIVGIKRTCDLIMIEILCPDGQKVYLHIECFFKVVKDNKTIACSNDMFLPGVNFSNRPNKRIKFKWDEPKMSLFDDSIQTNFVFLTSQIKHVEFCGNNLFLDLENDVVMEIIPDSVGDSEAYIILRNGEICFSYDNP